MVLFWRPLVILLAAGSALPAQELNVDDLLRKSATANEANRPKTEQYLYREYVVSTEIDEKGQPSNRHTETWEAIVLEGSEYRKLIQRDDRPLSAKKQKKENERLRKEAEQRRKPKRGKSKNPLRRTYVFGYNAGDELFFDYRLAGEESFNGRPAYVLEGTPKSGLSPASDREKQLQASRLTRWIDKEDFIESGARLEVTGTGGDARPGSAVSFQQQRLEDGTWLLSAVHIRYVFKPLRVKNVRGDVDVTRSAYRKFTSESRVVEAP